MASSSRDTDKFLSELDYGPEWNEAETLVARQLGLELDSGEHLGDDWVLESSSEMMDRVDRLVDSMPGAVVLQVLLQGLRGSYQIKRVHEIIGRISQRTIQQWRDGHRDPATQVLLAELGQAYKYGVRSSDLDFVLEMCGEPTLVPQDEEDPEDLRNYWFESLAKLKHPRAYELCRAIVRDDLGRWTDLRLVEAMRIIAKDWTPADAELFQRIATEEPDSWVRRQAKRILDKNA